MIENPFFFNDNREKKLDPSFPCFAQYEFLTEQRPSGFNHFYLGNDFLSSKRRIVFQDYSGQKWFILSEDIITDLNLEIESNVIHYVADKIINISVYIKNFPTFINLRSQFYRSDYSSELKVGFDDSFVRRIILEFLKLTYKKYYKPEIYDIYYFSNVSDQTFYDRYNDVFDVDFEFYFIIHKNEDESNPMDGFNQIKNLYDYFYIEQYYEFEIFRKPTIETNEGEILI